MGERLDLGEVVKDLHCDLARKYRIHGSKVESLWRDFDHAKRSKAVQDGSIDVLKDRNDPSLGVVHKLLPEWNLHDLTTGEPDYLVEILRYRATTSLLEQYVGDLNHPGGDRGHVLELVHAGDLCHAEETRFRDCYTLFLDENGYGNSIAVQKEHRAFLAAFTPAIQAGACVPQTIGEIILMRQNYLLQSLNLVIEDILEIGSVEKAADTFARKNIEDMKKAMVKLSVPVQGPIAKLSIPDLIEVAEDQKACADEFLNLLATEPVVLAHAVNVTFFSRPELVADEKGRVLPVHTDRYISAAFFEAINSAIEAAAIWNYMCRLLQLLQNALDKIHRNIILQEISNLRQLVYIRTQSCVKRHVQTGIGAKYFKRIANVYDSGNARVSMKVFPEELTRTDPQLHYLLRICQVDAVKAADWMDKLGHLHDMHPEERERLSEREFDAVCDHAIIVVFFQDLARSTSLPPLSRKSGQLFTSRLEKLKSELNGVRDQIDLTDFVVPINHLEEPGVFQDARKVLEEAVVDGTGTRLGFLYEDLIEESLQDLEGQYQQIKSRVETWTKADSVPPHVDTVQTLGARIEQRKQKVKSRPAQSSIFEPAASVTRSDAVAEVATNKPQKIKVKASTGALLSTLFPKSEARGTISWESFAAAMADIGFSVIPKTGSIYQFLPHTDLNLTKSLTLHRPHTSTITPRLSAIFAKRLEKVYGWNSETFETT